MAFSGTLTTEAECNAMVGAEVDTTIWTEANKNAWVAQAEAYLCGICKYDLVTNYASLTSYVKGLLSEYCERYAGLCGRAYNLEFSSDTDRLIGEDIINVHIWRMKEIAEILKDSDYREFIIDG